jgi:peptidyl-prolyl cis-trans isomerase D
LSQPVLTPFGYHLIRVDERKGDTLALRHILLNIGQSDSSATLVDRRADSIAAIAANVEDGAKFDEAATKFGLSPASVVAIEKEPVVYAGRTVPSVSAWAFSGVRPGETSELFDAPDAYYLARVDSLQEGGPQQLDAVREEITRRLRRTKLIEKLLPVAQGLATAARTSTLENAAAAQRQTVEKSQPFTRIDLVPGLGQFTEAIGAAFTVPVGQVSPPVRTADGVAVFRVDSRNEASKTAFEAQKDEQRTALAQQLRQQRVQEYMLSLRESAKIEDNRAKVNAALRRQSDV